MLKKVYMFDADHALLKAHAALADQMLHPTQLKAVQRFVNAYETAPAELASVGARAKGNLVRRNWRFDDDSWKRFVALRSHTGLTTGQMLHAVTKLEVGSREAL